MIICFVSKMKLNDYMPNIIFMIDFEVPIGPGATCRGFL